MSKQGSFSLTHPEPSTIRRRPNDGRDYASEAITHWLDAQAVSHDLDEAWTELQAVSNRLVAGDHWLQERGPNNPKWQMARQTHAGLLEQQKALLGIVKFRFTVCWLECCAVAGCLSFVSDPAAWIERHAPGRFIPDAKSIWYALQEGRKPPYQTFPPPTEAWFVEPGTTQRDVDQMMSRKDQS